MGNKSKQISIVFPTQLNTKLIARNKIHRSAAILDNGSGTIERPTETAKNLIRAKVDYKKR